MQITLTTKDIRERIATAYHNDPAVAAMYLFGSAASGRMTPLSDIDLAVLLQQHIEQSEYFQRRLTLIPECQSLLQFAPVEVVVINNAPLMLGHRIIANGEVILENDSTFRVRFEARLLSKYLDFLPAARRYQRQMVAQMTAGGRRD